MNKYFKARKDAGLTIKDVSNKSKDLKKISRSRIIEIENDFEPKIIEQLILAEILNIKEEK